MKKLKVKVNGGATAWALVSNDVYPFVKDFKWRMNRAGYIYRSQSVQGTARTLLLHRVAVQIVYAAQGSEYFDSYVVDHVNRVRHDCRNENLRVTDQAGNLQNLGMRKGRISRYRNVYRRKDDRYTSPWFGRVRSHGVSYYTAHYKTELGASRAVEALRYELGLAL